MHYLEENIINYATFDTSMKALDLLEAGKVEQLSLDKRKQEAEYIVSTKGGHKRGYTVKLRNFREVTCQGICSCASKQNPCVHVVAAAYFLDNYLHNYQDNTVKASPNPNEGFAHSPKMTKSSMYTAHDTHFPREKITEKELAPFVSNERLERAYQLLSNHPLRVVMKGYFGLKIGVWTTSRPPQEPPVQVKLKPVHKGIQLSCTCAAQLPEPLCEHQAAALLYLATNGFKRGIQQNSALFRQIDELVRQYNAKEEFPERVWDNIFLKLQNGQILPEYRQNVLPSAIAGMLQGHSGLPQKAFDLEQSLAETAEPETPARKKQHTQPQALFVFRDTHYGYSSQSLQEVHGYLCPAVGHLSSQGKFSKVALQDEHSLSLAFYEHASPDELALCRVAARFNEVAQNYQSYPLHWSYQILLQSLEGKSASTETRNLPLMKEARHLFRAWQEQETHLALGGSSHRIKNVKVEPLALAAERPSLTLTLSYERPEGAENGDYLFDFRLSFLGKPLTLKQLPYQLTPFLVTPEYELLLVEHFLQHPWAALTEEHGPLRIPEDYGWQAFYNRYIAAMDLPHQLQLEVEGAETKALTPEQSEALLYLRDSEEGLELLPYFRYQAEERHFDLAPNTAGTPFRFAEENTVRELERSADWEVQTLQTLRELHEDFAQQATSFFLPWEKVRQGNWFMEMHEALQAAGIRLLGENKLRHFRINFNRPQTNLKVSSGTDWFDVKAEVSFGDQKPSFSALQKAVLAGERFVELKDGTYGMLPEEWLKKLQPILELGQKNGQKMRVRDLHFSLIDQLYDEIDSQKIQKELRQKREKLQAFEQIEDQPLPAGIQAELRPYQKYGFNWLRFLEEFGWGGCLADDMGLGKTLQILAFLVHRHQQHPSEQHLIVVPTSLLWNWAAEIEKFTPSLNYYLHHGPERQKAPQNWPEAPLILTSYGTLRQDIEAIKEIPFGYAVLDESQAIKNPQAQTSKAVQLIQAQGRLVLTGTPVENNTFDLYSQFDFLNPGIFGSIDRFQKSFARPIDRDQDQEKSAQLQRLVKPFLLRRTKEQVAPELPEKTEMLRKLPMTAAQKQLYNKTRDHYRQQIQNALASQGLNQSQFLIMEGLNKLRQICSHPGLLQGDLMPNRHSAKAQETLEELRELTPAHKVLVFGNFLGTLQALQKDLEQQGTGCLYLDGQTKDRKALVEQFQNDPQIRVFLISMKAGGTGLNLTEAEYVFLLDPWWNPAAEAQAIDRAHRIGQQRNVTAIRLVCEETIEDKILKLQERKKKVAESLITTETGLMKALNKEDVMDLFG